MSVAEQKAMQGFETKHLNNKYEHMMLVYANGHQQVVNGGKSSVSFSFQAKPDGATLTHNHPPQTKSWDLSYTVFSAKDVQTFADNRLGEIRMVCNVNGKQVTTRLYRNPNATDSVRHFSKLVFQAENQMSVKLNNLHTQKVQNPSYSYKQYNKDWNDVVAEYNKFFVTEAKKYGLTYSQE